MTRAAHRVAQRVWGGADPIGRAGRVALLPASAAYAGATAVRNRLFDRGLRRSEGAPLPVISVGNLAVGGTGKTPVAAYLAVRLEQVGQRPAIVMRGYGGDEPLLHREMNPDIPVFTAPRRIRGVRVAARNGCTVAVLDDGFQHRQLARDLDVVLVPAGAPLEDRTLPAGPLREPLSALRRADLVIVTRKRKGGSDRSVRKRIATVAPDVPVASALLEAADLAPARSPAGPGRPLDSLEGRDVVSVCALARPRDFLETVREAAGSVEEVALPDHHPFTADEVGRLARRAGERPIVMTWKDAVKIREHLPSTTDAWIVRQRVVMTDDAALDRLLHGVLDVH